MSKENITPEEIAKRIAKSRRAIEEHARQYPDLDLDKRRQNAKELAALHEDYTMEGVLALWKVVSRDYSMSKMDTNNTIEITDEVPKSEFVKEVEGMLKEAGDFYSYGDKSTWVKNNDVTILTSAPQFQRRTSDYFDAYKLKENKSTGFVSQRWMWFPREDAEALLTAPARNYLPVLKQITDLPLLDHNFEPIGVGYHEGLQVYRKDLGIKVADNIDGLKRVLSEFPFKDESDRAAIMAAIVMTPIHHRFPGLAPALAIEGNQRNVGKTTLSQAIAILRQGPVAKSVKFHPDDVELEKRFGATLREGVNTLLIDNMKLLKNTTEISSSVIESCITDPELAFRILGVSELLSLPNTVLFILNMNNGKLSSDLASRMVTSRLYYEGQPKRRKFKDTKLVQTVEKYRADLLGEVLYMWEVWRKAGKPIVEVDHRCDSILRIVAGVLKANGIEGFLASEDEISIEQDVHYGDFAELVKRCEVECREEAAALWKKACAAELFDDIRSGAPNSRSQGIKFGLRLKQFIDEEFDHPEGRVKFVKCEDPSSSNSNLYKFVLTGSSGNTPEDGVLNFRNKKPSASDSVSDATGSSEVKSTSTRVERNPPEKGGAT